VLTNRVNRQTDRQTKNLGKKPS